MHGRIVFFIFSFLIANIYCGSNAGGIAGGIVGGLVGLGCVICVFICCCLLGLAVVCVIVVGLVILVKMMIKGIQSTKSSVSEMDSIGEGGDEITEIVDEVDEVDEEQARNAIYQAIRNGDLDELKSYNLKLDEELGYLHENEEFGYRYEKERFKWIHYAVIFEQLEVLKYLIEELKADVNVRTSIDEEGYEEHTENLSLTMGGVHLVPSVDTPLHIAAREGLESIVRYLVNVEGIQHTTINARGASSIDVAKKDCDISSVIFSALRKASEAQFKDDDELELEPGPMAESGETTGDDDNLED